MTNEIMPRIPSAITSITNPAADMKILLEALDNIRSATDKLDRDHRSEKMKLFLSLAGEASKNINPDSFVNKRKQLDEMAAKFTDQVNALALFSQKFEQLITDYCHNFPTQSGHALREIRQKLEDAQKQRDSEEATINDRIARIEQFLNMCSSTEQSKPQDVTAESNVAPEYTSRIVITPGG